MMIGVFLTMTITVLFTIIGFIVPIISLTKCKENENDICKPYQNVTIGE